MKTSRVMGIAMAAAMSIGWAAAAEGGKSKAQAQDKVVPASDTVWQPLDPNNPDGP
jgi:ABC-type oligopeptide transport system substrate-binding subunit